MAQDDSFYDSVIQVQVKSTDGLERTSELTLSIFHTRAKSAGSEKVCAPPPARRPAAVCARGGPVFAPHTMPPAPRAKG